MMTMRQFPRDFSLDDIRHSVESFNTSTMPRTVSLEDFRRSDDSSISKASSLQSISSYDKSDKYKLGPSFFISGCICGHDVVYREAIRPRKNSKLPGINIVPKVPAITLEYN